mmetsp:Transcript_21508/g.59769  ORF Transcript_21508/g.59769 Transcript_21508/m.59769 type:complete len:236 (+) Transcript_21508:110-817(+)
MATAAHRFLGLRNVCSPLTAAPKSRWSSHPCTCITAHALRPLNPHLSGRSIPLPACAVPPWYGRSSWSHTQLQRCPRHLQRPGRRCPVTRASQYATGMTQTCDVVIIGGGIIGLSIARKFLEEGPCRVVVLEKSREICCGATGAGQGYIWLAHREPDSAAWEMATRSKDLWSTLTLPGQPVCDSEWQVNGSMLVASCPEEARELELKAAKLSRVGIQVIVALANPCSLPGQDRGQ